MIKFALRPNLIYILQLIIWNLFRKIDRIVMNEALDFDHSSIFTSLMFLGDILSGVILYKYQERFLATNNNNNNPSHFMNIILRKNTNKITPPDCEIKIYTLIFFSSFFDFIEFTLSVSYLPKFVNLSSSLQSRLSGILTISSALFFYYVLKLQIYKHQFFSLLIIGICLIIVIISEFLFQNFSDKINIFLPTTYFILALVTIFFIHFFNSLLDSIEKYLFEYDFFSPFKTLMWEGIFGLCITMIYYFIESPLDYFILYYEQKGWIKFTILIFLLFLYILLCGGRNAFRVITNKIYSPMAKTLTDYILNPFYHIYDFFRGNDFLINGNMKYFYFILNLILSFIITICGCIYNEFIVLFCYKLEFDTHDQISRRATLLAKDESNYSDDNNTESSDDL